MFGDAGRLKPDLVWHLNESQWHTQLRQAPTMTLPFASV